RHKGRVVTYSRKVFIPLTNLCRDKCGYCTFAKPPGSPDAKTLTPDEVLAIARAGREQGCKEALFSLGEKPEDLHPAAREHLDRLGYPSTPAYLAAMCELVFEETGLLPHANCGVLTREELAALWPYNASARLILGGEQNIQAPPNLTPDAYGMYLLAGINDWGGVSPVTKDHINPERAWPLIRELREVTAEAGFELRERLCLYPEYVRRPEYV